MTVFVKTFALVALALVTNEITAMLCIIGQEPDPAMNNKYRWVIPVKDPCQCTQVQVGGVSTQTFCRAFRVTYYDSFLESNNPDEIRKWLNCPVIARCLLEVPLGMEDGSIQDESITASSIKNNFGNTRPEYWCETNRARLRNTEGAQAWCPDDNDIEPWIQVDFNSQVYITGLITQGRGGSNQWVTRYHVKYSDDGQSWYNQTNANGTTVEFVGNVDSDSPVTARFVATLHTRFLRILPTAYYNAYRLRFEVLGCQELA